MVGKTGAAATAVADEFPRPEFQTKPQGLETGEAVMAAAEMFPRPEFQT